MRRSDDGGRTLGPVERLVAGDGVGYPAATALSERGAALVYVAGERIWFRVVSLPEATVAWVTSTA